MTAYVDWLSQRDAGSNPDGRTWEKVPTTKVSGSVGARRTPLLRAERGLVCTLGPARHGIPLASSSRRLGEPE